MSRFTPGSFAGMKSSNPSTALSSSNSKVEDESVERLPCNSPCFVPSSVTQLLYKTPPELNNDLRISYLPGVVTSEEMGEVQLDWDPTVRIKCPWSLIEKRSKQPSSTVEFWDNENPLDAATDDGVQVQGEEEELMKLDQNNAASCITLLTKRLLEDKTATRVTETVLVWVCPANQANNAGKSNDPKLMQRTLDASCIGDPLYSSMTLCHQCLYPFVESARRMLIETEAPQAILIRGCAGSGKTEAFKAALQYLLFSSNTLPSNTSSARRLSLRPPPASSASYQRLAWLMSPLVPNSSSPQSKQVSKQIAASLILFDTFLTAPSGVHSHSSRCARKCRVCLDLSTGALSSINATASIIDFTRFRPKYGSQKPLNIILIIMSFLTKESPALLQQHCPGPLKEALVDFLPESEVDRDIAAGDGAYLQHILQEAGLTHEQWEDTTKGLLALVLLQCVTIVGSETALLAASSKPTLASIETLLGAPPDALTEMLLKKNDGKLGPMENTPTESRVVLDQISAALFSSLLGRVSEICCGRSMIENPTSSVAPEFIGYSYIDLVELPGYEVTDTTSPGGLVTFCYNYADEKMLPFFLSSSLSRELAVYKAEGIELPPLPQPNVQLCVDLLDKPSAGLGGAKALPGIVATLEETCQSMRPDDKGFCEKILAAHTKSKLVRGGGHKSKVTQFAIKHFFGETSYDAEGWVQQNKARVTDAITGFVQSCTLSVLLKDVRVEEAERGKGSGGARGGEKAQLAKNFVLAKCRDSLTKLLSSLEVVSVHHLLCIRPSEVPYPGQNLYDSTFMTLQVKHLLIPTVAQANTAGYPVRKDLASFYQLYRPAVPFGIPGLPVSLDKTLPPLRELVETLIAALYDTVIHNRPNNYGPRAVEFLCSRSFQPIVGTSSVFLSLPAQRLFSAVLAHSNYLYGGASALIQSGVRRLRSVRTYAVAKRAIVMMQKYSRRYVYSKIWRTRKLSALVLQRQWRRFVDHSRYSRLLWAVSVVKDRLRRGGMLQRLRFLSLSRSARVLHGLARGLRIRQQVATVLNAADTIQRASLWYIGRSHRWMRKHCAVIALQRTYRGYHCRRVYSRQVFALTMRRKQRTATRCVRRIQGAYRSRGVRRRFQRLVKATFTIQQWARARSLRHRYLKLVGVAVWLQRHTRRRLAVTKMSMIRVVEMLQQEHKRLQDIRKSELLQARAVVGGSGDVLELAVLPLRDRPQSHTLYRRHVISYDVSSDLGESYEQGWLPQILSLQNSLQEMRCSIAHIAVGGHHTVVVDSADCLWGLGIGDCGQFGNGDKSKKHSSVPIALQQCESAIAREEMMHSKKIQAACDPLAHRALHPTRPSGIASPAKVAAIVCGRDHTLLLTKSGFVWAWGSNKKGQCGTGLLQDVVPVPRIVCVRPGKKGGNTATTQISTSRSETSEPVPLRCVKTIACCNYSSACLLETGSLYTWGAGDCLGGTGADPVALRGVRVRDMTKVPDSPNAQVVGFFSSGPDSRRMIVHDVVCGDAYCLVLASFAYKSTRPTANRSKPQPPPSQAAELFAWGSNLCGQLGVGDKNLKSSMLPLKVALPVTLGTIDPLTGGPAEHRTEGRDYGKHRVNIISGGMHTVLSVDGAVYAWGWNAFAQCGVSKAEGGVNVYTPTRVPIRKPRGRPGKETQALLAEPLLPDPGGSNKATRMGAVVRVTAGLHHSACLTDTGVVFAWGGVALASPFTECDSTDPQAQHAPLPVPALGRGSNQSLPPSLVTISAEKHGYIAGLWSLGGSACLLLAVDTCSYDPWVAPMAKDHIAAESRPGQTWERGTAESKGELPPPPSTPAATPQRVHSITSSAYLRKITSSPRGPLRPKAPSVGFNTKLRPAHSSREEAVKGNLSVQAEFRARVGGFKVSSFLGKDHHANSPAAPTGSAQVGGAHSALGATPAKGTPAPAAKPVNTTSDAAKVTTEGLMRLLVHSPSLVHSASGTSRGVGMPISDKATSLEIHSRRAKVSAPSYLVLAASVKNIRDLQTQVSDRIYTLQELQAIETRQALEVLPKARRASLPVVPAGLLPPHPAEVLYGFRTGSLAVDGSSPTAISKRSAGIIDGFLSAVRSEIGLMTQGLPAPPPPKFPVQPQSRYLPDPGIRPTELAVAPKALKDLSVLIRSLKLSDDHAPPGSRR